MGLNTTLVNVAVINQAILDTNIVHGTPFLMDYLDESAVIAMNTLDQSVTLSTEYSSDGGATWASIGSTFVLAAGTSLVTNQYASDLTGIRIFSGQIRVNAVAGTAPTTGNLTVVMQGMND